MSASLLLYLRINATLIGGNLLNLFTPKKFNDGLTHVSFEMVLLIYPREDIFLEGRASIFKEHLQTLASRRHPIFFSCLDGFSALIVLGVGLLDMSSFAKFIIMGESRSVVNYLQMLCSNDVDIPVGGIIPTGMLNENGLSPSSLAINILLYTHTYTTTICTSSY